MNIDLVIFDCDGVLVDSEPLSAHILKMMMAEIGRPISDEIFRTDFLGRSFATAAALSEKRFGAPFPADFQLQYRDRLLTHISRHLKVMTGVEAILANMCVPFCIATSSSPQRLSTTMEVTGLARFFKDRQFTASEVKHGKPAPDLFLHAAHRMNTDIRRSLILEDSEMGIRGAITSGAMVWHFKGGSHIRTEDRLPDDLKVERSISDMAELHYELAKLGLCSLGPNLAE